MILLDLQSQQFESSLVHIRLKQRYELVITHNDINTSMKLGECGTAKSSDLLDKGHLLQLTSDNLLLPFRTDDVEEMFCVKTKGSMDKMMQLKPDNQTGREHRNGNDILQNDEHLTKYHFGTKAEITFHDIDGLIAGHLP